MAKFPELGPFLPLAELKGVYVARNANLRCTAIKLKGGGVCLFSPVLGLGVDAFQSLAKIGPITHLLAPNHYHNKALGEYSNAFPEALICAPPGAVARLAKQTAFDFDDLSDVSKRLPKGMVFVEPKGLKTGEVWLSAKVGGLVAWFVVDALAGLKMTAKFDRSDAPEILKTFPKFGVRDSKEYCSWFGVQLRMDQPRLVVPCHGTILAAADLPKRITRVMRDLTQAP